MSKKVFILGSIRHLVSINYEQQQKLSTSDILKQIEASEDCQLAIKACKELGKALAAEKYTFIVGSSNALTIDCHVILGANEMPGQHEVIVFRPNDKTSSFSELQLQNIKKPIHFKRFPGNYFVSHIEAIKAADVILMLGGGETLSPTAAYATRLLNKPLLVIPSFGGASDEIWNNVLLWDNSETFPKYISDVEKSIIREKWSDTSATTCVSVLEKLIKNTKHQQTDGNIPVTIIGILTFLIFGVWFTLYTNTNKIGINIALSVMILSFLSTLLGVFIRELNLFRKKEITKIAYRNLAISIIVALILVFGFNLIGGALSDTTEITMEKFKKSVITTSLLGLAVGFLLDKSISWAEEHLKPNPRSNE